MRLLVAVLLQFAIAASTKPNILLLFPDEWRFDWDGHHSDPTGAIPLKVPFLQSVAAQSTRFTQAYVAAPVCAPSRSCLAAGREYDQAGVLSNFANDYPIAQTTFYDVMRDAGYWTMTAGKDDLTKASQLGHKYGKSNGDGMYHQKELGFDDGLRHSGKEDVIDLWPRPHEMYGYYLRNHSVTLNNGSAINAWDSHHACFKNHMDICDKNSFPADMYEDNWVSDNAIALLRRKPQGKPWFLQINYPGPHPPFLVTADMADSVSNRSWPAPQDNKDHTTCQNKPGVPGNGERCNYAAEIENLDRLFEIAVNEVKALGELDNTIVCVSSDHGDMLGDHGDTAKSKPWQGSASVPLLCFGPGIKEGQVHEYPVGTMDLAATFIDYAGATLAPNMTSVSLRSMLEGTAHSNRPFVSSGLNNWRMVVKPYNHTYLKFICCKKECPNPPSNVPKPVNGWTKLLYDTAADPFDMHDLKKKYPEEAASMEALLPPEFKCGQKLTADEEEEWDLIMATADEFDTSHVVGPL